MRTVQLILGPPGTGKTTQLISMLESQIERGADPSDIAFVSFSRRAVREVIDRLDSSSSDDDFPFFRTIHSTAFRLCGLKRQDVLQPSHLAQFSETIGMRMRSTTDDPNLLWEGTLADQALGLWHLARARETSLQHEWKHAMLADLSWDLVNYVVGNYERFKKANGLSDFHDMIVKAAGELPVHTIYIDEAQDTSTAQWSLLRRIVSRETHIVIAGDDDQCIYSWSGASSDFLLRVEADVTVLPRSYRLPSTIKEQADRVVRRIRQRRPKAFEARGAGGAIEWHSELEDLDLGGDRSWLLLARSNYQLHALRSLARQQGVVYTLPSGEWSWSLPSVRAAQAYERCRKGHSITRAELRLINQYLARPKELSSDTFLWGDLWSEDARSKSWMEALPYMPAGDREYIRALRKRGESLVKPGRVRIGTVHSVKGAEADNVVLITDISKKVEHGRLVDPDTENRVLYVALTRAKEKIVLMRPRTSVFWSIS